MEPGVQTRIELAQLRRFRQRQSMYANRRSGFLLASVLAASMLSGIAAPSVAGEPAAIAHRQRVEKKNFTDSEIVDGFLKVAFGAEYHLAGRVDRIRKYEMPVRVFAEGTRADR